MTNEKDPPKNGEKKARIKRPANSPKLLKFNTETDPITLIRRAALKDRDFLTAQHIVDLDIPRQHLIPFIIEALREAREHERAKTIEELRASLDFMSGLPR